MEELKQELRDTATQLEAWAIESETGGWSSHQVQPLRARADRIWKLLGKLS